MSSVYQVVGEDLVRGAVTNDASRRDEIDSKVKEIEREGRSLLFPTIFSFHQLYFIYNYFNWFEIHQFYYFSNCLFPFLFITL